jgi:hypothetical protein
MGLLTQYHLRCEEDLWPDMMYLSFELAELEALGDR